MITRIARATAGAATVLLAWGAIMLAMPFFGPDGRQVAVIGDGATAVRAVLAAGGRVVEIRRGAVLAQGDSPGFVRRLYASGAPAVLEGRVAGGCFAKAGA